MARPALALLLVFLFLPGGPLLSPPLTGAAPLVRLTIATGAPASPPFLFGQALAALISRNLPGVEARAVLAPGPVEGLLMIGDRRAELAITGTGRALSALLGVEAGPGIEQFKGNPIPVRTLTPWTTAGCSTW